MCLFCSVTWRQAFRALTAAAVGGAAQRLAAPAVRSRLIGAAGFAVLAASDPSPSAAAEPVIFGEGGYRYRVVEGWGALPPGFTYRDGAAVCVDSKDNVYVFNRGAHPVIVFDRDGQFLRSWGEDIGFVNAHGAAIGPDDMLYLTDDFGAAVRKCTPQGKVVMTIGTPGKPLLASPATRSTAAPTPPSRRGRDLCLRRLPERPRPQIFARRKTHVLVGRAGDRPGPVQSRAQHRL